MPLGQLPYVIIACPRLKSALGRELSIAAETALRQALSRRRTLEIACMQVLYKGRPIVFSTRIGPKGDIVLEMEEGDPRFAEREVEESQLRSAELEARERMRAEARPLRRPRP